MPRTATCTCGRCYRCRHRVHVRQSRERERLGTIKRKEDSLGFVPTAQLAAAIASWGKGTTQVSELLSERCGVHPRAIDAIRRGTYAKTSLRNADAICTAIGLHIDLLYLYEEAA